MFGQTLLLEQAEIALMQVMNETRQLDIISIVGMPVVVNSTLMNCAVVCQRGKILGIVPKTYLPNYKEFYEQRWFAPSTAHADDEMVRICGQHVPVSSDLIFESTDLCFGVEICEDVWATIPPSSHLALKGADVIFNMSADTENISKHQYLRSLLAQQSARCLAGYVLLLLDLESLLLMSFLQETLLFMRTEHYWLLPNASHLRNSWLSVKLISNV